MRMHTKYAKTGRFHCFFIRLQQDFPSFEHERESPLQQSIFPFDFIFDARAVCPVEGGSGFFDWSCAWRVMATPAIAIIVMNAADLNLFCITWFLS